MSQWNEVRSSVADWYTSAAERTEELAQIGVRQVDRYGIHRRRARGYADLGEALHRLLREGEFADVAGHPELAALVEKIDALEGELRAKEEEIEAFRRSDRAGQAEGSAQPD